MRRFLKQIAICLSIAILIHCSVIFVFQGAVIKIVGMSMFPTVSNADRLYCFFTKQNIERYDIVVVEKNNSSLIKRVIGMPGDKIIIFEKFIAINGHVIDERYLYNYPEYFGHEMICELKQNEYFVMGDNRNISLDSRHFGPIKRQEISKALGFYIRF